ncbi:SapB/AmfS family lanthipeptide [Streptomyces sp. NPDC058308]
MALLDLQSMESDEMTGGGGGGGGGGSQASLLLCWSQASVVLCL